MRTRLGTIALIIALAINLPGCAPVSNITDNDSQQSKFVTKDKWDDVLKSNSGLFKVASNESFELSIDGSTTEISIKDKRSNSVWSSNPNGWSDDPIASPDEKALLGSQLRIEYIDDADRVLSMNTNRDSVSYGQYEFSGIENGIRVTYTLGEKDKIFLVPSVIEKLRFESFLEKMNDEDKEYITDRYTLLTLKDVSEETKQQILNDFPSLEKNDIYRFSNMTMPDFIMEELDAIFTSAGYTAEDLNKDNTDNSIETAAAPITFTVSMEYSISESGLHLKIPMERLIDDDRVHITSIDPLMFFGAAGTSEQGYIFVPDGSGALINLNSKKTNYDSYTNNLYGYNYSFSIERMNTFHEQCYLPVFGMKKSNLAFWAVIESGDVSASIKADTAGRYHSFNYVGASFSVYSSQKQSLPYGDYPDIYMFSATPETEDIQIRYQFLYSDEATYSGMASAYQQYLLEKNVLKSVNPSKSIPYDLTIIGSVDYKSSFLLFPVTKHKALTGFLQAQEILEKLNKKDISNINMRYLAWANNGFVNRLNNRVELSNELGNKQDFIDLLSYGSQNGVSIFPDVSFWYAGKKTLDFNINNEAARGLTNQRAYKYEYDLATGISNKESRLYIVKPNTILSNINSFIKDYSRYENPSLSVSNLGTDLNADFNKSNRTTRAQAKHQIEDGLSYLTEKGYNLTAEGANLYTLKYLSHVYRAPEQSGNYYIIDQSIPFYQMVLHGYISYSQLEFNLSGNWQDTFLKTLETGAVPAFLWMYAQNHELKETDYGFTAVQYDKWLDKSVTTWKELNLVLSPLQNQSIINHKKCAEGLYRSEYSEGTIIFVNYNDIPIVWEGITIGAKGYKVLQL